MLFGPFFKWRRAGTALALFISLFAAFAISLAAPDSGDGARVRFVISRGEGVREIASGLKDLGLIKSTIGFTMYSLTTGKGSNFKPGAYSLSRAMSGRDVAHALEVGFPAITVTVKEGMSLVDVDRELSASGVIQVGELIEYDRKQNPSLEGFLFPDTYVFSGGTPAKDVVRAMRGAFDREIGPLVKGLSEKELYEKIIIASLIEKEALYPKDKLGVAGVIQRRMAIGMRIQIDATVVYMKCKGAYITCPAKDRLLSRDDLKQDGPYNTYLRAGLPPTPIANPGKDSVAAAMNPTRSANIYYISNPATNRLIFAETLDDHNLNRGKYHTN